MKEAAFLAVERRRVSAGAYTTNDGTALSEMDGPLSEEIE